MAMGSKWGGEVKAFITGVSGQDGSYLAELLLNKGYEVHGLVRRSSTVARPRIDHIKDLILHEGDVQDYYSIHNIILSIQPDEVYNLAAQSHVGSSFGIPEYTMEVVAGGLLTVLNSVKELNKKCKVYQAGSSEMFGESPPPQNELTPFLPKSPYAIAKVTAHNLACHYRSTYGMHICNGILFNHESPRRGENFVTRKITLGAAKISHGLQDKLKLGNIDAKRDWGYAPEYVGAMWEMMQHPLPDDYVVATGITHTVKDFLEVAFSSVGLDWEKYVEYDKSCARPADVQTLLGDASKIKAKLGWVPKVAFKELVEFMVRNDMERVK